MLMQKIREKSKYALWPIIIATPLAFFGLSGDTFQQLGNFITGIFSSEDFVDTDLYIGKIEDKTISRQQFDQTFREYPSFISNYVNNTYGGTTTANDFRPWAILDDIWNLYIEQTIIQNEISTLNLTSSNEERDYFLKNHTPESFKTILMNNGLFNKYTDGIWEEGEEFIDCDEEQAICKGEPGWEDSWGNNIYDEGEGFTDKKEFDSDSFKNTFKGLNDYKEVDWFEALETFEQHLTSNSGGFGIDFSTSFGFRNPINYPNLSREKINFLYNQLYYISDKNIKNKIKNDLDNYSINLLIGDYASIPDSEVETSDIEIKNYYNKNKEEKYKNSESVTVEYVVFKNLSLDFEETEDLNTEQIQLSEKFSSIAKNSSFNDAIKEISYSIDLIVNSENLDTISLLEDNYKPYNNSFANSLISKENSDSSAYIVKKLIKTETAEIFETLETTDFNLSGFPQNWGPGRNIASFNNELTINNPTDNHNIIRFIFDYAERGQMKTTDSFTLASNNDNVVLRMVEKNEASFQELDQVKDAIKSELTNNKKKKLAINDIESILINKTSLSGLDINKEYIKVYDDLNSSTLSLNFFTTTSDEYNIGQNATIAGCLSVMKEGEISYIIDSKNANNTPQLFVVELVEKVEKANAEMMEDENKAQSIKNDFKLKMNTFYDSWLSFSKEQLDVIDKRQSVF